MKEQILENFPMDRGGRREISDRRFRVAVARVPEQRTGWKRRNGWDRRWRLDHNFQNDQRSAVIEKITIPVRKEYQ